MTRTSAAAGGRVSTVDVRAAAGGYPVLVGAGLLDELPELLRAHAPAARYAIVSDDRVAPLYGERVVEAGRSAGLRADLYTFPEGEASKARRTWAALTDELLAAGLGRDGCVVALGGGVTGDLAGFVAATYLRGVPLVQAPTSLVAMIDASVGGKVGVDTGAGKNLVGAFHAPRLVAADVSALATLPGRERAQGLVEALKHGAILDAGYFGRISEGADALLAAEADEVHAVVLRSVELKAGVVEEDEHEVGLREILNFGHTFGHAIEAASGYAVSHGAAVAAGMILEARLGEAMGVTAAGSADRIEVALAALGFGLDAVAGVDAGAVLAHLRADKKVRAGTPRWVLLGRVGEVAAAPGGRWSHEAPADLVVSVLGGAWRG